MTAAGRGACGWGGAPPTTAHLKGQRRSFNRGGAAEVRAARTRSQRGAAGTRYARARPGHESGRFVLVPSISAGGTHHPGVPGATRVMRGRQPQPWHGEGLRLLAGSLGQECLGQGQFRAALLLPHEAVSCRMSQNKLTAGAWPELTAPEQLLPAPGQGAGLPVSLAFTPLCPRR